MTNLTMDEKLDALRALKESLGWELLQDFFEKSIKYHQGILETANPELRGGVGVDATQGKIQAFRTALRAPDMAIDNIKGLRDAVDAREARDAMAASIFNTAFPNRPGERSGG